MKEINLSNLSNTELLKRVAIIGPVTRCMQLRVAHHRDGERIPNYNIFECGVDIWESKEGSHILISTTGVYGYDFDRFLSNYLHPYMASICKQLFGIGLYFCDDSDALATWGEDEEGNMECNEVDPIPVDDASLIRDMQRFDSFDEYMEAMRKLSDC